MKLILRDEGMRDIEIKEITTINKDSKVLFFFLDTIIRPSDITEIERELSEKIGIKCVVLDKRFRPEIMGC